VRAWGKNGDGFGAGGGALGAGCGGLGGTRLFGGEGFGCVVVGCDVDV
jgi:hypothetical protein